MFGIDLPLWAIPIVIFCLRICDVSIGTIRVIYTIRGYRAVSCILGAIESLIWILAIAQVMKYVDEPINIVAWSLGFAAGIVFGITLEKWIASGWVMTRLISLNHAPSILLSLRENGFGVTSVPGEGKNGPLNILFIVSPRKRGQELLKLVRKIDEKAFVTVEPVSNASGGFIPTVAAGMRK